MLVKFVDKYMKRDETLKIIPPKSEEIPEKKSE